MRVTNKMLSNNFLRDMQTNLGNLKTIQGQMTSGKEIRKPSDNPFKVARAMQLYTDINTNKQYSENIKDARSTLDTTDTALGQVGDVLQRVRELLVSSGNAALGSDERTAIKSEINEKVGELSQILNTNFDGKYIFGGTRGSAKPVMTYPNGSDTGIQYANRAGSGVAPAADIAMIGSPLNIEISQGVTMKYNVTATDVLVFDKGSAGPPVVPQRDLMQTINNITSDLASGNTANLTTKDLNDITDAMTNVLKLRAEVGAKSNRMDSALNKNGDENFNMTDLLSKTEDIDITQKTMEFANMQTVYVASLQTSARVIQPSLMDYLR